MMVLKPGQSSAEKPGNEHPRAEQWLFVISGHGRAIVGRHRCRIADGTLLLIERNEKHQITNTSRHPLITVNFYAPPAYGRSGGILQSVR